MKCPRCQSDLLPKEEFKCPHCTYQLVEACPNCDSEVGLAEYKEITGNLCKCPRCNAKLRLQYNSPLITDAGELVQPLVILWKEGTKA